MQPSRADARRLNGSLCRFDSETLNDAKLWRLLRTGLLLRGESMARSVMLVTRGTHDNKNILGALHELHSSSDRTVAVVGGSLVELTLTDALTTYLHEHKKITDDLFRQADRLERSQPK